jgi:hypothetical protein
MLTLSTEYSFIPATTIALWVIQISSLTRIKVWTLKHYLTCIGTSPEARHWGHMRSRKTNSISRTSLATSDVLRSFIQILPSRTNKTLVEFIVILSTQTLPDSEVELFMIVNE